MKNKIIRIILAILFAVIFLLYIGPVITVGEYNLGTVSYTHLTLPTKLEV